MTEQTKQYFIKRPIVLESYQWFKNGDHPEDKVVPVAGPRGKLWYSEGKLVKWFKVKDELSLNECKHCGNIMKQHGWIDTLEGGHIVCPSDWIMTGTKGEHWPVKNDIFQETYERVNEVY